MAQATTKDLTTLPVGRLGLIPLISCKDLGEKVNEWLIQWRKERSHEELDSFAFEGYQRESYLIPVQTARFGSGEAKCTIMESVRGDDIYLMVDVCNYSLTYSIGPYENLMSPDDHFQDLKRVIGAIGGKARRVNVIMPYLYESRQNIRSGEPVKSSRARSSFLTWFSKAVSTMPGSLTKKTKVGGSTPDWRQ